MIKKLILLFACLSISGYAQHSIKGEMHPVENYPWMLLYKLKGSQQDFIAYDSIKDGKFEIAIPKEASSGIYRLIYDQKNQLFVDVIYANEDIAFSFHPKYPNRLVQFSKSNNNKLYYNYLKAISEPQQQLDSLQVANFKPNSDDAVGTLYKKKYNDVATIQAHFEKMAEGTFAYHFIKASARYNPKQLILAPADYLKEVQTHFFDNIDFDSPALDNSTFKHDKINDFIFYLNQSEVAQTQIQLRKEAIDQVIRLLMSNSKLSKDVQESLLYNFALQENVTMTNYVLNYYLQLPKELQDVGFINDVNGRLRTAVGNIAPNILWDEKGEQKTLHTLSDSPNYLVVFWSSGCSHCLKELPLLKEYLKDKPQIKVVAVGLEDDKSTATWQKEIVKYPNWIHIYGKDKWKNRFANDYGVSATPSFYFMDARKKILAKPDDVSELKKALETLKM